MMDISFIIPTNTRQEEVTKCISSISKSWVNVPDFCVEVIVVVNGEFDYSKDLENLFSGLVSSFYIGLAGPSKARNLGIKKSSGEYLVLLDDDSGVAEDFLVNLRAILKNRTVNALCGRIIDPKTNSYFTVKDKIASPLNLNRLNYQMFKGSALIIKRNLLDRVGCYDEDFGPKGKYRAAEESDLFFRIKMAKEAVVYLPELVFFHPLRNEYPAQRTYDYSYATGALLAKYTVEDKRNSCIYILIMFKIISKNLIRALQFIFSPFAIEKKDRIFHYSLALKGVIRGAVDFIKDRKPCAIKKYF